MPPDGAFRENGMFLSVATEPQEHPAFPPLPRQPSTMKQLPIKHLLLLQFAVVAALVGGFVAKELGDLATTGSRATWIGQANRLADHALLANGTEGVERGTTAAAVASPAKVTPATRARIAALRQKGDADYTAAVAIARGLTTGGARPKLAASLATLADRRKALETARSGADAVIMAGVGDGAAPKRWNAAITNFIDALAQVRRDALTATDPLDAALTDNVKVKEFVYLAMENAGRERANFGPFIARNEPLTPEMEAKLKGFRAIVDQNLALLQVIADQSEPGSGTRQAWAKLDDAFLVKFQRRRLELYAASAGRQPYTIDGATWVAESTTAINTLIGMAEAVSADTVQRVAAAEGARRTRVGMLVAAVLLVLLVGGLSLWTIRQRIFRPLDELMVASRRIADGELRHPVKVAGDDELGQFGELFERMRCTLAEMALHVKRAANGVVTGADQIGACSRELLATADAQVTEAGMTADAVQDVAQNIRRVDDHVQALASSVEETSASIAEMAVSFQQVAGNADALASGAGQTSASIQQVAASIEAVAARASQADAVATQAATAAQTGSDAVSQTAAGLERINMVMAEVVTVISGLGRSSEEIGKIVELIDDIADQTNLLALNAAIEAARAGEHGRGFAVVADEVRKLAERSATATRQIATLIKSIQQETDLAIAKTRNGESALKEGTELSIKAGRDLTAIVGAVREVADLMGQIAAATQEQSTASAQIAASSKHMNMLTLQVSQATREQALSGEQIVTSVDLMNRLTREISMATADQTRGAEKVVAAMGSLYEAARATSQANETIARGASALDSQAKELLEAASRFQTEEERPNLPPTQPAMEASQESRVPVASGR